MNTTARRALLCGGLLVLLLIACGGDEEPASATSTVAEPATAPAPEGDPAGEAPPEEVGLREWVEQTHRQALIAVGTGDITLSAESQANQRAQRGGLFIKSFSVTTTYFAQEGQAEGVFNVTAHFFPSRQAVRYTAFRAVAGSTVSAMAHPAVDTVAALTTWDQVIRRRAAAGCEFPLLDAAHTPTGFSLDQFAQGDLDRFAEGCAAVAGGLAGAAQRSRQYYISWNSQEGGGGGLAFNVTADGAPEWRTMDFYNH